MGSCLLKLLTQDSVIFYPVLTDVINEEGPGVVRNFEEGNPMNDRIFYQLKAYPQIFLGSLRKAVHVIFNKLSKSDVTISSFDRTSSVRLWDLVRYDFDPQLEERNIANQNISTGQGPIISFLQQVCQAPFIEMYGDVFPSMSEVEAESYVEGGANIYFTKDPEDENITTEEIEKREQVKTYDNNSLYHIVIRNAPFEFNNFMQLPQFTLWDDFIINESISQTDSNVFTYFRLEAKAVFTNQAATLFNFPAVLLYELASRYGFRSYQTEHNMLTFDSSVNEPVYNDDDVTKIETEADLRRLLRFMVGQLFYYSGTITMVSNRDIRKGCTLRNLSNNFIYYIEGVSQVRTPNGGKTVLQVSRGLTAEGHRLVRDLISIGDDEEGTRTMTFNSLIFSELLNKNY